MGRSERGVPFYDIGEIAANRPRMQTLEFFSNFGGSESGIRPLFTSNAGYFIYKNIKKIKLKKYVETLLTAVQNGL